MNPTVIDIFLGVGSGLGTVALRWAQPNKPTWTRETWADAAIAVASAIATWRIARWSGWIGESLQTELTATWTAAVAIGFTGGPSAMLFIRLLNGRMRQLIRKMFGNSEDSAPPHPLRRWGDTVPR